MTLLARALGPQGWGSYRFDPVTFGLVPSAETGDDLVVPAFVDLHCHGAFGIDFMSASRPDMVTLADRLEGCGYEGFLATTITAEASDVQRALDAMPEHPAILGVHLEGPFISPEYPGAQPILQIQSVPDQDSPWTTILGDPRVRLITLAPEIPGALDLIKSLDDRGVIVSLGHTNATFAQAIMAREAGARHTTHTYNAMRGLHHREAGMVGFALLEPAIRCEVIYDRHHVCREAASILFRSKSPEDVIAVSDSTLATGLPAGSTVEMWGHKATVGHCIVHLAGTQTLAGSAITLLEAFRNLFEDFGPEIAIRSCSLNPRLALGLGSPRHYLRFDSELNLLDRF